MGIHSSIIGARSPSRLSRFLRTTAVLLTVVAMLAAVIAVLTFRIANQVMRREPTTVENFPANVMPAYSIVDFPSLDGQTSLSGWFFPSKGATRATIVMVHGDDVNRLQFGEATAVLYKSLVAQGFNILSFDLRHSGDSAGRLTTYGYTEWEDVLSAVDYARRTTTTHGVVLYGFGNGAGVALAAWQELPATEDDRAQVSSLVSPLPFTKDYILAMMLDGPRGSLDDSIRSAMDRLGALSVFPLPYTVPLAVRLSAGANGGYPLSALASRYQRPMLVMEARTAAGERTTLLRERLRLHPETTSLFERAIPGGETLFGADTADYLASITDFLDLCFP